jgi:[ribosomal protein S18]-alanine N-acetyltransferase
MEILPLEPPMIPACIEIMLENPLWQRYGVTQTSLEQRFAAGLTGGASILAALEDGQVQGLLWYAEKGAFGRSGYILLIGVHPQSQSRGVGSLLMDTAETAVFANCADIFLLVSDFNVAAQQFYNRRGYVQVGSLPDYVIPGVAELIFRKRR